MKKVYSLILMGFLIAISTLTLYGQQEPENKVFNEKLANELGADEYGMRTYVMAFLKAGPNKSPTPDSARTLQAAHMANINRLAEEGYLVLAGPFLDNGTLRGIYVFAVEDIQKAKELTASDPAIKAGTLVMELYPWYGSAALLQLNQLHATIQKTNF
jgi:uncharacterized protein YciI